MQKERYYNDDEKDNSINIVYNIFHSSYIWWRFSTARRTWWIPYIYLHRHGEKLKKVLESKRFFRLHGWGASYIVKIHPNGQAEPLELFESQNKYYDKKVKEIIESVPAEEFGDEIKSEYLIVRVCINFSDLSDIAYVSYRTLEPHANIHVIRVSTTK